MNTFIKKHEYNYIKKCLRDLNNTFVGCMDSEVIEGTKFYINDKILDKIENLSDEQKNILDITKLTNSSEIDNFIGKLNNCVSEVPIITKDQIKKLFKKDKTLKLPDQAQCNSKNIYLGWIDEGTNKFYIIYTINNKSVGLSSKIINSNSNNMNICALCNHVGKNDEIAFVSSRCKIPNSKEGAYKSIAFNVCLNSLECNERITSTKKLEEILKGVNNIK
ncbi:MAG: FBP domain-containing protein [Sarcina sp.]